MAVSSTSIDKDGQPVNLAFNAKRNQNKAASTLVGILNGITADNELKDIEIFFLQNWLENQEERKNDLLDIYEDIQIILNDKVITKEERDDLFCSLNDCIDYSPAVFKDDFCINQLLGFLKGIAADDAISTIEFDKLRIELLKYESITSKWPFFIIGKTISDILQDGIVETSELRELCELVQHITGTKFTKYGDAVGGATTLFDEPIHSFNFKKVCLTGKFISGTRNNLNKQLESLGAIIHENVTMQTDVLLIGTLCSRDWIHSSTGRKIEKAIELKENGQSIIITNEQAALLNN
jgi:hypothetical protein